MSVSIEKNNGSYYVNVKPENVPNGSLGGAGIHQKCESKEAAEIVAAQYKEAEAEIKKEKTPEIPATPSPVAQSTPPEGVGAKLDKTV